MKTKKINFTLRKKKINLKVKVVPWWFEGIGLMFSRREKARALLFEFNKPMKMSIHSYFVFYEFFAIWLDEKNKIIEIKRVKPFEINVLPSRKFVKLMEIPINSNYDEVIRFIDGRRKI